MSRGYLHGADVSHWQTELQINELTKENSNIDFLICKATEGKTYKDAKFNSYISAGLQGLKGVGAYHLARFDRGNTALGEATNFCNAIKQYLELGIPLLVALDLETFCFKEGIAEWAKQWLQVVKTKTGLKPLVYTSAYYATKYHLDNLADTDLTSGLWCAYWGSGNELPQSKYDLGKWGEYKIWQYTNTPVDYDRMETERLEDFEFLCGDTKFVSADAPYTEGECRCGCTFKKEE